jgi:hypothetical protein
MSEDVSGAEHVIDVKDIDSRHRHMIVFQPFGHLAAGDVLQLVDHDTKPLRFQLEARHGSRCLWTIWGRGLMSGAFGCSKLPDWTPHMREQLSSVVPKALSALRPEFRTNVMLREPASRTSRAERVQMISAAASHGHGECPPWVILALEQCELHDTREIDREGRRSTC